MTDFIQFALLGCGAAAVYALLANGVVLIVRGSGILNFSQGALAMVSAFLMSTLRQAGWPFVPSLVVVLLFAVIAGTLIYLVIMRRLRRSSALAQLIATAGILLSAEAAATLIWGTGARLALPILPHGVIHLAGIGVPQDRILLLGIAALLTLALWAAYRYTTLGLATSASAQNVRATAALGWSPDVLAVVTWGLGSALAALAGVLIAPISGLQAEQTTFLIIPAVAAAFVGSFKSFPLTFLGAAIIGVGQSEAAWFLHIQGAADCIPFVLLIIAAVVRGRGFPAKGSISERLPALGTGKIRLPYLATSMIIAIVLIIYVLSINAVSALIVSLCVAVMLLSVVVLTGYAGQLSLAQYAIGGVGGYISGRLVATQHWPFELAILAGVLGATLAGGLVALPALRSRGISLAAITLALGVALQAVLFNNSAYTGGAGGTAVGVQKFFGIELDPLLQPSHYATFVLLIFVLCALAVANVRRGRAGRRLIAVRANERAASALGISVTAAKMFAFTLSSAIAGLAGTLLAFSNYSIIYGTLYDPVNSIIAVVYAVLGGVGYLVGPLVGSTLAAGGIGSFVTDYLLYGFDRYLTLIGGVSVVLLLLQDPDGIVAANIKLARRFWRHFSHRISQPEPTAADADASARQVAPVAMPSSELAAEGLTVSFGGIRALTGLSIVIRSGSIVGLIGPNGAGKSTTVDALTGFVQPRRGVVTLNQKVITGWPAYRRARAGISRSFQSLELFEDLTIAENIRVASDERDKRAYVTNLVHSANPMLPPVAMAAVHEFGLADDLAKRPGELSYGRRRLAAIARAVSTRPSILILDEPAAGLDSRETAELADLVRRLAQKWNMGILLIEHDVDMVMSLCDHVVVLDFGKQISAGTPSEVRNDPAVVAAYLGITDQDPPAAEDLGLEGTAPERPKEMR